MAPQSSSLAAQADSVTDPLMNSLLLWGILLIASAAALRLGQVKVFGPILFYDLVRTSRRSRFILVRFGYVLFLTCFFLLAYAFWFVEQSSFQHLAQMGRFCSAFFGAFMVVQFLFICS